MLVIKYDQYHAASVVPVLIHEIGGGGLIYHYHFFKFWLIGGY